MTGMFSVQMQRKRYIAFMATGDSSRAEISRLASGIKFKHNCQSVKFIDFDRTSGFGILLCGHLELPAVKSLLGQDKTGEKTQLEILGVSGTIRAAKRKFVPRR
jgi:RNase P/RNase MRP subunit POP5